MGILALAFGLAAASFFPAIILGIFYKKMNSKGAIAGMIVGITLMLFYMMKYKLQLLAVVLLMIGGLVSLLKDLVLLPCY